MAAKSAYGAAAAEVAELFADYVEGNSAKPALVVSTRALGNQARAAVEKSLAAFGYGSDACTYVTVLPRDGSAEGGDIALDSQALFLLIEGIDPLYVVVADRFSAERVAQAYRAAFDFDAPTRLFGRSAAVFENLEQLVTSPDGKQVAWKALKSFRNNK